MSFTSVVGRWYDGENLATLTEGDKPLSAVRCVKLVNNLNHLRDTSTQERVSFAAFNGQTLIPTDISADAVNPSVVFYESCAWSILEGRRLARPVLRVAAHRSASGTSHISAALFPFGEQQNALGFGALAYWPPEPFTAETPTVVLESAADIRWSGIRRIFGRLNRPSTGVQQFNGRDPDADGNQIVSSVDVMMTTLVIFVRNETGADITVSLVQLREFSGP